MSKRVGILVAAYVAAVAWMICASPEAQTVTGGGAVSNHDAAVGEEVVIMLLDGTAIHGTVGQLLPSGYIIYREGQATTVPLTQVSKVIHVGQQGADPAAAPVATPVPAPAPDPAATPAPTAAPYTIPVTSSAQPSLPPDFPTRPRKPGAALVGIGWPVFGICWLSSIVFFNLGMWIPGGWDYYSRIFYPMLGGSILGIVLAIVGHSLNKKAKRRWMRERNELLNPGVTTVGRRFEVQLLSPVVFDGGGGLGMTAVF